MPKYSRGRRDPSISLIAPRFPRAATIFLTFALAFSPVYAIGQSLPGLPGVNTSTGPSDANVIDVEGADVYETYGQWLDEIAAIEDGISTLRDTSKARTVKAEDLIGRIRSLTEKVDYAAASAKDQLVKPENALAALGPPPQADEPPEASIIAEERERHQRSFALNQAVLAYVRIIKVRAESLTSRLTGLGEIRWRNWITTRENLAALFRQSDVSVSTIDFERVVRTDSLQSTLSVFGVWFPFLAIIVVVIALAASLKLSRSMPQRRDGVFWATLSDRRELALARLAAAFGYGVFPAIGCVAAAMLTSYYAQNFGLLAEILTGVLFGLAVYIWLNRIFEIALKPTDEKARFLQGSDEAAQRVARLLQALCILIAISVASSLILKSSLEVSPRTLLFAKLSMVLALSGYALISAGVVVFKDQDPDHLRRRYNALRFAAALVGVASLGFAVAGYVNLAVFMCFQIAGSILLLAATFFIRPILHDGIHAGFASSAEEFLKPTSGLIAALAHLTLDLFVMLAFLMLLVMLWGIPPEVVWLWIKQTTNTLAIGDFRISLYDLAIAALSFAFVLVLLRFVNRIVSDQIIERITVDVGVRDSIVTILRYLSFLIALVAAVATLGADVTSLALVFGALLLGVGFGLQNVVDNLVSGFIILFQRPIKSGDWITVGDHQGLVKKTGLISTEIVTFEDASVVLPNSEIVSSPVLNRTLGQSQGRVDVPVGVAYGSDVGLVLNILHDCAQSNDSVISNPEVTVVLRDFSDSALDFELRAFVPDIRKTFEIASELRIAILKRFRDEGVEIPFPQRDIWLKNSDISSQKREIEEPPDSPPQTEI